MDQATTPGRVSPPWLLIIGLLMGAGLLLFMTVGMGKPGRDARIVELTEANWQKEVVESKIPVLVDFTAEWCEPCKVFAPTLDKIAARYADKIKVGTVDFDTNEQLREKYRVNSIPRVLIFVDGEPVASFEGAQPEAKLSKVLDSVLAKRP